MNLVQSLYDHGQSLLTLSWECRDEEAAARMRRLAHELLDLAYSQDELVQAPRAAAG